MPSKRERNRDSNPSPEDGGEASAIASEVLALRDECLSQLNSIAARAKQISVQRSADWARALQESELGLQMRQQTLSTDYMNRAREASARAAPPREIVELSQRCSEEFDTSHREACKSVTDASERLRAAYETSILEANRDWDAACLALVAALRQRLEKASSPTSGAADPVDLATIGQSLTWIASMMRNTSAT